MPRSTRLHARSLPFLPRVTIILLIQLTFIECSCSAAIVAFLTESVSAPNERFQTTLMMAGTAGDRVELINLDLAGSTVNAAPLADYGRLSFTTASGFAHWHSGDTFGTTPGFESQITLDAFSDVDATPFVISGPDAFPVGMISFDYSGLGLAPGGSITIDILGRDEGASTRTTSIAMRPNGSATTTLVDPDFSQLPNSHSSSFAIATAIPEPGATLTLALASLFTMAASRVRRRERQ